jgi:hypothetical protein
MIGKVVIFHNFNLSKTIIIIMDNGMKGGEIEKEYKGKKHSRYKKKKRKMGRRKPKRRRRIVWW